MVARPKNGPSLATVWLREYARTYLPSEAMFDFAPDDLRRAGLSLIDVRNLLRTGVVTYEDKLDGPGGLWIVEGCDCDGMKLIAAIEVRSDSYQVKLRSIERQVPNDDESAA
jgi:hypothetical protein